jgi:hypothetical protein
VTLVPVGERLGGEPTASTRSGDRIKATSVGRIKATSVGRIKATSVGRIKATSVGRN